MNKLSKAKIWTFSFLFNFIVFSSLFATSYYLLKKSNTSSASECMQNQIDDQIQINNFNVKENGMYSNEYFVIKYNELTDKYLILINKFFADSNSFELTKKKILTEYITQFEDMKNDNPKNFIFTDNTANINNQPSYD